MLAWGSGLPGTQLKGGQNGKACPESIAQLECLDPGGQENGNQLGLYILETF